MRKTLHIWVFALLFIIPLTACAQESGDMPSMVGLPLGGGAPDAKLDLCPQGARTVGEFLSAWQREDFDTMYALIDSKSKEDYSLKEAGLDFQFLEFKPYVISSVRKIGDDFEFLLTYGEWKYGDKDLIKMLIDGRTFKIIMTQPGHPFTRSAASYF